MESELDRDFSLEIAELEIILETKDQTDLTFDAALRSALGSTGNSFLFPFPANIFFMEATNVAAVRIDAADEATVAYVYEIRDGDHHQFKLATAENLPEDLLIFAANYAALIVALRPLVKTPQTTSMH